jgi:hypothetical protein
MSCSVTRVSLVHFPIVLLVTFVFSLLPPRAGVAQSLDVPIYSEGRERAAFDLELAKRVETLRASGKAINKKIALEQLQRTSCRLKLPPASTKKAGARDIWARARQSHLRVGWSYQCVRCEEWHLKLAGGYALTTNGAVATAQHVVRPPTDLREGILVATDDDGKVFAVTEVLAANRAADVAIVRIACDELVPLALSTNVAPGDTVYCFSDPLERRGYFSQGIVNRFYEWSPGRRTAMANMTSVLRINISVAWASGSSGSAVLDECGNAIGQVSTISLAEDEGHDRLSTNNQPATIIFHEAASARDVLALVKN